MVAIVVGQRKRSARSKDSSPTASISSTDKGKGKALDSPTSLDEKQWIPDAEGQDALRDLDSDEALRIRFYEPPDTYESKHRWDPRATWTPEEERAVRWKIDLRVTAFACLCFFSLNLDRNNIGNALSDGFLKDLGMNTADYNNGMTIFYCCFLFAELPSQLISKKLGSDRWIPIQIMIWSVITIAQVGLKGKPAFFGVRALLGLFEGGFIADTVLYLTYYYTAAELTIRLSIFYMAGTFSGVLGNLLAAGILQLRGHMGWEGWRWLFLIEGILTFCIGAVAWLYLPPSPTETAGGPFNIRGKGWFTEREEVIIVNKVLRDDPTKADMHNREGLNWTDLKNSALDYDLWPLYLIGLLYYIGPTTIGAYYSLTVRGLGYTTFQTNLLGIPGSVLQMINNFLLANLSKKVNERLLVSSIQSWWCLILFITISVIPDDTNRWAKWSILSLILGNPFSHPITISTTSVNSGSVRTRTFSAAVYNSWSQLGFIVASHVYNPSDAPYYRKGNRALVGVTVATLLSIWAAKAWYIWRNKRRAAVWDSFTEEQKEEYLRTTNDKGNKRLDFRFQH